jgi:chemotaxis protein methyltransferase CheR
VARFAGGSPRVIVDETGASERRQSNGATEGLEISLLLDAMYRLSGFDFREYSPGAIRRLVLERVRADGLTTISSLLDRVIHEPGALQRLAYHLTAQPAVPFRDPQFFATLASHVLPRLRTYPFLRLWVAGSGSGADLYSLAVLLHEAGLAAKVRIYATESTERAIEEARSGVVAADALRGAQERYRDGGGRHRLDDYLEGSGDGARFSEALRGQVLFARHHLPSEGSFNVFHAVVTRPPVRLLGRAVMYRVHRTLYESVERSGFLCLASKEILESSPHAGAYEPLSSADSVFRRVR